MNVFTSVQRPTLLLDEEQAKRNIRFMAEKAKAQSVRFRPHFKTHQSAEIGQWFREAGVKKITVSSVSMASYFIQHGWRDIAIAFPVNWREIDEINRLADHNHLELLVESPETARFLQDRLKLLADVWIKIDVGSHRAGIWWENQEEIEQLVKVILGCKQLILRGFLAHAGQTYHANSSNEIQAIYQDVMHHLNAVNKWFEESQKAGFEISVGDTPGCKLSANLGNVDEIRPGNFVFYDATMLNLGVCQPEEIAVAVACPVVAKHPQRLEAVIYGGAVHLSKEFMLKDGNPIYGLVASIENERWGAPLNGCYVSSLYQEHGIVKLSEQVFNRVNIGDLLCIIPIHACLTAAALGHYLTLTGRHTEMMPKS